MGSTVVIRMPGMALAQVMAHWRAWAAWLGMRQRNHVRVQPVGAGLQG